MSVGLLTITHNGIGESIVEAAESILGPQSMPTRHFSFHASDAVERFEAAVAEAVAALDTGEGVLVLTDLYGSTPCNVARRLAPTHHVRVLSGLSLPMALRVFTYARLDLDQLVRRATDGGRVGVIECTPADGEPP